MNPIKWYREIDSLPSTIASKEAMEWIKANDRLSYFAVLFGWGLFFLSMAAGAYGVMVEVMETDDAFLLIALGLVYAIMVQTSIILSYVCKDPRFARKMNELVEEVTD